MARVLERVAVEQREVARLWSCVLLDKPSRREVEVAVDFVGFSIEDLFVADSRGRNGHYGSRIVFDDEGYMFFGVGDRQAAPRGDLEAHQAQDPSNHAGTINRLHDDLPALRESWEKYDAHFLGASGVDTYHLLTTFPVRSLDDLAGRRILAPGAAATWLRGTGAIAVDGALSSYYTQLQTGVADGVLSILTGAHPFRIHEVAPYVTLVGIGAQCTGALVANLDVWQGLPVEAREILGALGHEYSSRAAAEVVARYDRALAALAAEGAQVSTLPPAEKQRWIDGLPPLAVEWATRNEARGLPARAVLRALIAALREEGVEPVRDWSRDLAP